MFVGLDNDVALLGRQVLAGQWLVKGPAGEIGPAPEGVFEQEFEPLAVAS